MSRVNALRWWLTPKRDGQRWRRAHLLNRLRWLCWANLVDWSLHRCSLRECRVDWICHGDANRNGTCYCGKIKGDA